MSITIEEQEKIRDYVMTHHLPTGLGAKEEACSIAAINLALTGRLTDEIPDCMSYVIGRWIIPIQDSMPDDMRNSDEWKMLLPLAAGTGRELEKERLGLIMDWMWDALALLLPIADKNGFGAKWAQMIRDRDRKAADATATGTGTATAGAAAAARAAARAAAYAAADAAADAAYAARAATDAAYAARAAARAAAYAAARAANRAAADAAARAAAYTPARAAARAAAYADAADAAASAAASAAAYAAAADADFWQKCYPPGLLKKLIEVRRAA